MKTKEFIKQVTSLGYEVDIKHGEMRISWYGKECVCIDLEHQFGIYIYWRNLGNNAHRLFVICMEYARTPIKAREEEEKFYLKKIKSFYDEYYREKYAFLNFKPDGNYFRLHSIEEAYNFKTQFTQKEIDQIKKEQHTDLSEFKQIPVEEMEE
jgi:hypothetical protein